MHLRQRYFDLREQEFVYRKGKMISGNAGIFREMGEILKKWRKNSSNEKMS